MKKKILALLLTVLMVVSVVPMFIVGASAEEVTLYENDFSESATKDGATAGEKATATGGYLNIPGWSNGTTWSVSKPVQGGGQITMTFKAYPNFNSSGYSYLKLNGTSLIKSGGGYQVDLCGSKYNSATNGWVNVTLTVNPLTGAGHIVYDQVAAGYTLREADFNVGAFETITVQIAQDQINSCRADDIVIKQEVVNDPILTCSSIDMCKPGDTINVYLSVANNDSTNDHHLTGLCVTPVFDEETFEFVSAENVAGTILTDFDNGLNQVYAAGNGGNGDLVKYTLKVKDSAKKGSYDFTVAPVLGGATYGIDSEFDPVINAGKINVVSLNGDINFEGYQFSALDSGAYSIRFVSSGNLVNGLWSVGFEIKTTNLQDNKKWDVATDTVYKELSDAMLTGAPTASQLDKEYVASLVLTGIPSSITEIDFEVKPYVIVDGNKQYGQTKTANCSYNPEVTLQTGFGGFVQGNGSAAALSDNNNKCIFANWGAATLTKTFEVNTTGTATIEFDMYPNLGAKAYNLLTINGTVVLGLNASTMNIGESTHKVSGTGNSSSVVRHVKAVINLATGDVTVSYANASNPAHGDNCEGTINVGSLNGSLPVIIGNGNGNQHGWTALNFTLKQK